MMRDRARLRQYQREWSKRRFTRWQAAGACGRCGQPVTKFKTCQRCRRRDSVNYARRQAQGEGRICAVCGTWKRSVVRPRCLRCGRRVAGQARCATAKRHPTLGYLLPGKAA